MEKDTQLDKVQIKNLVRSEMLFKQYRETDTAYVPAAVSNRHVHLSSNHVCRLFGEEYSLKRRNNLSQPGQYACEECLTLIGPTGNIGRVRILGPVRPETQVEVSLSDTYRLGVEPVVRMSGELTGTPGILLKGPAGEVELSGGVIVAARHLHISCQEAKRYGLRDKQVIRVRKSGAREVVYHQVKVRVDPSYRLELHLDRDEANAASVNNGDLLEIVD